MIDIATVSRILITLAIFLQVGTMIYYKSKVINPISFFLYAIGSLLMCYSYYQQDGKKLTQRTYFKLVNSIGLLAIAVLALDHVKW